MQPPGTQGRVSLAVEGALIFGVLLPLFCVVLTGIGLAVVTGRTRDEAVGLAGFLLSACALPLGAVVGAAVSALGDPQGASRRRKIAAAVLGLLALALWGALIVG